ncbi:hypothetical protein ACJVDH_05695 [Pedobacter sp. AW1-32]|uniref:hypothetical protein n=1 Tax=Pedobacter sp. AW1-32 TaxID=3383026 RepID=UPI003FEDF7C0
MKEKKLHNDAQTTSYAYNERGWLTKSTSNEFSMELKYQDGTNPNYNGNISNQYWGTGNTFPNVFTYQYDKLNRLTKGSSTGVSMSEELTYDVMGNIETLARDGGNPNWYDYPNGNQLWYVGYVTDGYEYDANGNAIVDGRLHFNVEYNQLNLPKRISNINLNYTYDATGRKLRKNSNNSLRNYIDGIEYKPEGTIDFIQTEEGIAQNNGSNEYSYRYNLSDHLGNVRATFYFNPANNNQLEVIQRDDYSSVMYCFFGIHELGTASVTMPLVCGRRVLQVLL